MTNHKLISDQIPEIATIYGRKHLHTVIVFIYSKQMTTVSVMTLVKRMGL